MRERRTTGPGERRGLTGKLDLILCVFLGKTLPVKRWSSEVKNTAEETAGSC